MSLFLITGFSYLPSPIFYLIFGNCYDIGFFRIVYDFEKHKFSEQIEPIPWITDVMINRAKTHRYDLEQTF